MTPILHPKTAFSVFVRGAAEVVVAGAGGGDGSVVGNEGGEGGRFAPVRTPTRQATTRRARPTTQGTSGWDFKGFSGTILPRGRSERLGNEEVGCSDGRRRACD